MTARFCKKCNQDTDRVACDDRCKPCLAKYRLIYAQREHLCATPNCNDLAFRKGTYCRRCSYESNIRIRFNLTLEDYGRMAYKQNFCCALCLEELNFSTKRGAVVDHCHTTGQVRGILHSSCNTAIGLFDEDPVKIELAGQYVNSFLNKSENKRGS